MPEDADGSAGSFLVASVAAPLLGTYLRPVTSYMYVHRATRRMGDIGLGYQEDESYKDVAIRRMGDIGLWYQEDG